MLRQYIQANVKCIPSNENGNTVIRNENVIRKKKYSWKWKYHKLNTQGHHRRMNISIFNFYIRVISSRVKSISSCSGQYWWDFQRAQRTPPPRMPSSLDLWRRSCRGRPPSRKFCIWNPADPKLRLIFGWCRFGAAELGRICYHFFPCRILIE